MINSPILVTGAHRTGTTWVGKTICFSKQVEYIHEPFNPKTRPGVAGLDYRRWFMHISDDKKAARDLGNALNFKYNLIKELRNISKLKDIFRIGRDFPCTLIKRIKGKRPLMKDPIAVLSAEWLYKTFGMDVIVMIRNPASFVSSLKKYNWSFDFSNLMTQKDLMENKLYDYRDMIEEHCNYKKDIIDQGILLWRIIYKIVKEYRDNYPEWQFVRFEDLAREPASFFRRIYEKLNLKYDRMIANKIQKYSTCSKHHNGLMNIRKDSNYQIKIYQDRLTNEEIFYVKKETEDVWRYFYKEDEW